MTYNMEQITPEMAKAYLAQNTANYRNIKPRNVRAYAADMKAGNWQNNGEPIIFYKSGKLADGQHRLLAIVNAGVPVQMLVVRGVDDNVSVMDVGATRSAADIARHWGVGETYLNTILAVSSMFLSRLYAKTATKMQIVEYASEHKDELHTAVSVALSSGASPIGRRSACALAAYVYIRNGISPEDIHEFFTVLNTGYPAKNRECSAPLTLRNALMFEKYRDKEGAKTLFQITYQAIGDYLTGRSRKLKYKPTDEALKALDALTETDKRRN